MIFSASIRQRLLFWLATRLGWVLVLLLGKLTRVRIIGQHHLDMLAAQRQPYILCVWHGRILLPIYLHRRSGLCTLVSLHRDGEMLARTLEKLGYRTIRGSSNRGGLQAFRQMVQVLRQGANAAIIPDGPRGPRHHFKTGAIRMAQHSGACILPLTFSASRRYWLKSWDRFLIWLPFSRAVAIYSQPFEIPSELTREQVEEVRKIVEAHMIKMESLADTYFPR